VSSAELRTVAGERAWQTPDVFDVCNRLLLPRRQCAGQGCRRPAAERGQPCRVRPYRKPWLAGKLQVRPPVREDRFPVRNPTDRVGHDGVPGSGPSTVLGNESDLSSEEQELAVPHHEHQLSKQDLQGWAVQSPCHRTASWSSPTAGSATWSRPAHSQWRDNRAGPPGHRRPDLTRVPFDRCRRGRVPRHDRIHPTCVSRAAPEAIVEQRGAERRASAESPPRRRTLARPRHRSTSATRSRGRS
jgi:hypothetical protein